VGQIPEAYTTVGVERTPAGTDEGVETRFTFGALAVRPAVIAVVAHACPQDAHVSDFTVRIGDAALAPRLDADSCNGGDFAVLVAFAPGRAHADLIAVAVCRVVAESFELDRCTDPLAVVEPDTPELRAAVGVVLAAGSEVLAHPAGPPELAELVAPVRDGV